MDSTIFYNPALDAHILFDRTRSSHRLSTGAIMICAPIFITVCPSLQPPMSQGIRIFASYTLYHLSPIDIP